MPMPNFLIIGAEKSGTTALYYYLKQHPQIYMSPVKEPRFFAFEGGTPNFSGPGDSLINRDTVTNLRNYLTLFEGVTHEAAVGEASVVYLALSSVAAARIKAHVPHCKLIAILRRPADRAYSAFLYQVREGREPLRDFALALDQESIRRKCNWRPFWLYKQNGFYHTMLRPYFDRFPGEHIRIYLYEDWNTTPREVLREIFLFLQVDDTFVPDMTKRHNVTFLPRSHTFQAFLKNSHPVKPILKPLLHQTLRRKIMSKMQSLNQTKPPPLDPELRRQLTEEYRDDILKLQDLIGRDLSHWLKT